MTGFIIDPYRFVAPPSGEFLPTDVTTATLEQWLDSSDAATIIEAVGLVSQWDDKSGNLRHVANAAGGQQPLTNVNDFNGVNVIAFDGSDALGTAAAYSLAGDYTMVMVLDPKVISVNGYPLGSGIGVERLRFLNATSWRFEYGTNVSITISPVMTVAPHIIVLTRSGTTYKMYRGNDGLVGTTLGGSLDDFAQRYVGHWNPAAGAKDPIDMGHISAYSGVISDAELNSLCGDLAIKFTLPWTTL